MTSEMIAAVAAVAGILTALGAREIVPGVWARMVGGHDRERALIHELRAEIADMQVRIDRLRADRDHEASRVRTNSEHASMLRRLLYDEGHGGQVPPWPIQED